MIWKEVLNPSVWYLFRTIWKTKKNLICVTKSLVHWRVWPKEVTASRTMIFWGSDRRHEPSPAKPRLPAPRPPPRRLRVPLGYHKKFKKWKWNLLRQRGRAGDPRLLLLSLLWKARVPSSLVWPPVSRSLTHFCHFTYVPGAPFPRRRERTSRFYGLLRLLNRTTGFCFRKIRKWSCMLQEAICYSCREWIRNYTADVLGLQQMGSCIWLVSREHHLFKSFSARRKYQRLFFSSATTSTLQPPISWV